MRIRQAQVAPPVIYALPPPPVYHVTSHESTPGQPNHSASARLETQRPQHNSYSTPRHQKLTTSSSIISSNMTVPRTQTTSATRTLTPNQNINNQKRLQHKTASTFDRMSKMTPEQARQIMYDELDKQIWWNALRQPIKHKLLQWISQDRVQLRVSWILQSLVDQTFFDTLLAHEVITSQELNGRVEIPPDLTHPMPGSAATSAVPPPLRSVNHRQHTTPIGQPLPPQLSDVHRPLPRTRQQHQSATPAVPHRLLPNGTDGPTQQQLSDLNRPLATHADQPLPQHTNARNYYLQQRKKQQQQQQQLQQHQKQQQQHHNSINLLSSSDDDDDQAVTTRRISFSQVNLPDRFLSDMLNAEQS